MQDFEKLGVFYLGSVFDPDAGKATDELLLYDARDLVTHAVCVGMTGSGKTGLCIAMLEEAALDGVPALVIDPKGDLANLLLTFPELRPADFQPWVNEDDARRQGLTAAEFAAGQAELWKKGLAASGQDGARIARLRAAAEFAVYTPGSTAGLPVSILDSFAAPPAAILDDAELLQDRVNTTVTGLLGLVGVEADPLQSREHILLSLVLISAWRAGRGMPLPALIQAIQSPPVDRVGVLDLESFFPSKDRFALAMRLNNLLAAPGFESWTRGDPLDVGSLLHTASGKPRVAIFSIAHLSDAERMFFVSLLLNQTLGWTRAQSGTTSLRAILYMDEIYGYLPPVANPPSKAPLLTLLKQARAFGVGVMLATQNPVDLDYKALSNAGTWFIGRLQTERDKARVLDGLEGAAAAGSGGKFNRSEMERLIAGLGNRVFLMHDVHEDAPVVMQTRWVMSYLRGPLTRNQIRQLMPAAAAGTLSGRTPAPSAAPSRPTAGGSSPAPQSPGIEADAKATGAAAARPVLPPDVMQYFVPLRSKRQEGAAVIYQPALLGCGKVYLRDAKTGAESTQDICSLLPFGADERAIDWDRAEPFDASASDLDREPAEGATFARLPSAASQSKSYEAWKKSLADSAYRTTRLDLHKSPALGETSRPGETERDFRVRLQQVARERRDELKEKLRQKYAPKLAALADRARRAQQAVDREAEQARQSKVQTAISFGTTVLGAIFGRKTISAANVGRAATAARGVGRSYKESQDVGRARETVGAVQQQMQELEAQLQSEMSELDQKLDPATEALESVAIRPKKTDITVQTVALAWLPHWRAPDGTQRAAWN